MPYRKTLVAGSQHRLFESEPPSAYELSKCRVEPLNLEEFAVWENLSEYSESMRKDMKDEVADLTGFVPRLIGLLFKFQGLLLIQFSRKWLNISNWKPIAQLKRDTLNIWIV